MEITNRRYAQYDSDIKRPLKASYCLLKKLHFGESAIACANCFKLLYYYFTCDIAALSYEKHYQRSYAEPLTFHPMLSKS